MGAEQKRAVILVSGGLDSATVLAIAKKSGFETYSISFHYGQRHEFELKCAERIARSLGARQHEVVGFDLRTFGGSALTSDIAVPKDRLIEEMSQGIPYLCSRSQHDLLKLRACVGRDPWRR